MSVEGVTSRGKWVNKAWTVVLV